MSARTTRAVLVACVTLMASAPSTDALGHTRSVSHARWYLGDDGAQVFLRIRPDDLTDVRPDDLRATLLTHVTAQAARNLDCKPDPASFRRVDASDAWQTFTWSVRCDAPRRVSSTLSSVTNGEHIQLVRAHWEDQVREIILTSGHPRAAVTRRAPRRFSSTLLAGARHVLVGLDHLVFLLALVVLGGSLVELAKVVTGFTAGHAVTLGLCSAGVIGGAGPMVEALIGLSVLAVATENAWLMGGRRVTGLPVALIAGVGVAALFGGDQATAACLSGAALFFGCYFALSTRSARPRRLRWIFAALLGLVHGLGFASALDGATATASWSALAGFNIGVELGQLALLVPAALLCRVAHRRDPTGLFTELVSAATGAMGAFWFATRLVTFGG